MEIKLTVDGRKELLSSDTCWTLYEIQRRKSIIIKSIRENCEINNASTGINNYKQKKIIKLKLYKKLCQLRVISLF